MNESDKENFINMVTATLELYGRRYTMPETYQLWFEALKPFDYRDIRQAMQDHALHGKGAAPVPADIVRILQAKDGHPGPEEAWSMVVNLLNDESLTVVWTPAMQVAFGRALELQDDLVAARMTFKECYQRALDDVRSRGDGPVWQVSIGTSKDGQQAPITEAVRLGRMTPEHAHKLLAHVDGLAIEDLARLAPPEVREKLAQMQVKRIEAETHDR